MDSASKSLLEEYLGDVSREMQAKSAAIRRHFASHRPSAGDNREDLVESFLRAHLPAKFGVSAGLVVSADGVFSNQADLLIVDDFHNTPLYAGTRNKLWPAEAVFALVEVKTHLNPAEIADAVDKARRFKTMARHFCEAGIAQRIRHSLFVLWSFGAPEPETFKANFSAALKGIPRNEHPDLIIVPDNFVGRAGDYLELSRLGQPGSAYRNQQASLHGSSQLPLAPEINEIAVYKENSLLAGYVWLDSWLRQAGSRLADPLAYVPANIRPLRSL